MTDDILRDADGRMRKTVEALTKNLSSIRSGRASAGLVEGLRVDYHGVPTPLKQIAAIVVPEARLLVIQPWDKTSIGAIEKAILKSDLGLNPASDGIVIRLPVPALTEDRRKDLVKLVKKRVEEGRVALRNIRRDSLDQLRRREKEKEISADESKRASDQLQKLLDRFMVETDEIGHAKEKELLEV